MTSKQALKELKENAQEICKWELDRLNIIEKDLEILEIIKNHILNVGIDISGIYLKKHYNGLNEPYYTIEIKEGIKKIVSIEEFNTIKEWYENGKTN